MVDWHTARTDVRMKKAAPCWLEYETRMERLWSRSPVQVSTWRARWAAIGRRESFARECTSVHHPAWEPPRSLEAESPLFFGVFKTARTSAILASVEKHRSCK